MQLDQKGLIKMLFLRPYKDALSHEEAVRRIKPDKGKHFDPDIVDAFLKCEEEFLKISNIYKY